MLKRSRWFTRLGILFSCALLLPGATCVSSATQTLGDGITAAGASGILGSSGQAATAIGTGLHFLGDLVNLISLAR